MVSFPFSQHRVAALAALFAIAAFALPARSAEHVALQNGFDMRCDHHATVNGSTRLFLGSGEDNYIDLPPQQITAFEFVAELPAVPSALATPAAKSGQNDRVPPVSNLGPVRQNHPASPLSPIDLAEMLSRAGADHNLDVDLLASLVKAESNGNARALSRAGAAGLMQLMPATASDLGVSDRFEPGQNVRGGTAYLDTLLTHYNNNLSLALAAYNAGPAAVDRYHGIPPYAETRAYVARVIHEFNRRVLAREAQVGLALQH
jgi:soluble lytic murein transglycosylase-like protein